MQLPAKRLITLVVACLCLLAVSPSAQDDAFARRPALIAGADRVMALQRTTPGWEGTWYWYVGNTFNATNLTGITALGLVEAYRDTHDVKYLEAAKTAAAFSMAHLGTGATGVKYHARMPAPDITLLHRLTEETGDPAYAARGTIEWNNIKTFWPTAGALDTLFRSISRRLGAWDLAAYLDAAKASGDDVWAAQAAAILANTSDPFYYGTDNGYYPLTVSGALRTLVVNGYASQYDAAVVTLLRKTVDTVSGDNVDGGIQATAYVAMALRAVGGPARAYANDLARWLASQQQASGGWIEPDDAEYSESDGEAVAALGATIGAGVRIKGGIPARPPVHAAWKSNGGSLHARAFDE